jgi:hypothetical protein
LFLPKIKPQALSAPAVLKQKIDVPHRQSTGAIRQGEAEIGPRAALQICTVFDVRKYMKVIITGTAKKSTARFLL